MRWVPEFGQLMNNDPIDLNFELIGNEAFLERPK